MLFEYQIKPLRAYVAKVLPAVYEDSLSYYEVLAKLTYKLNETIENLNTLEANLPTYIQQQINATLGDWEEQMNARFTEQNAKLLEMAQRIAAQDDKLELALGKFKQELDVAINNMQVIINEQLASMWSLMSSGLESNRAYTDAQIAKLRGEFPEFATVYVISPVDGRLLDVQTVLRDMYDVLRYGALTAAQYDTLQLTAETYDNKHLTAFRYDMYGLVELWPYLNPHSIHSTTTGELTFIAPAIYQLADHVRENGITANAYDGLALSADVFDRKDVTAYSYDWSGVTA